MEIKLLTFEICSFSPNSSTRYVDQREIRYEEYTKGSLSRAKFPPIGEVADVGAQISQNRSNVRFLVTQV